MLALSACGSDAEPAESTEPAGMANPASEFCAEQGGEIEIVEEADGEVGYCNLPDGTRIEEWEYFRSESASASAGIANPASEFCAEQGGEVEIVDEADGEVGYCNLPDGTRIEEWEYFRSES
jgi:putative hemolysin